MKDTLQFNDPGPPGRVAIEIHYSYTPPDPVTLTQRCGYEPRGASADIQLTGVHAVAWTLEGKTVKRDSHPVWLLLDAYAFYSVILDWEHYHQLCLQREVREN